MRARLSSALSELPLLREIAALGRGTALGQLIVVASSPLLTRLYSPPDIGYATIIVSYVTTVSAFSALRYELAIVDVAAEDESLNLFVGSLMINLFTSFLATGFFLLCIRHSWLSLGGLSSDSALYVPVILVLTGFFICIRMFMVRRSEFRLISRGLVWQGVGRAVVPLAASIYSPGWAGLCWGEIIGRATGVFALRPAWSLWFRQISRRSRLLEVWQTLRKYRNYPLLLTPSTMFNSLQALVPIMLILRGFGPEAAGFFGLVLRVSGLPAGLIAASIADVFHSRFSVACQTDPKGAYALTVLTAKHLAMAGLIIYLPLAVLSPFIFPLVFGSSWAPAGQFNAALAPSYAVLVVSSPMTRAFSPLGFYNSKLFFDVAKAVIPAGVLFAMSQLGQQLNATIIAYSAVCICLDVLLVSYLLRAIKRWSYIANADSR